MIDFTTTATVRPELLERTLRSFTGNMKGINFSQTNLYINIDPAPRFEPTHPELAKLKDFKEGKEWRVEPSDKYLTDFEKRRKQTEEVARKYFGNVICNHPETPSFSAAVNWLWENAQSDIIFHLEDDWALTQNINALKLIKLIMDNSLWQLALRAYPRDYNSIVLSPSFIHKDLYKKVAGKLDITANPESQLRGKSFGLNMPDESDSSFANKLKCIPDMETNNIQRIVDGSKHATFKALSEESLLFSKSECVPTPAHKGLELSHQSSTEYVLKSHFHNFIEARKHQDRHCIVEDTGRKWAAERFIKKPNKKHSFITWEQL